MRAQRQSRGLGVRRSLRARLLPRRKVNPWLDRYRVRRDGVYRHRVPYEQCLRMNNDFRNSSKFLNNSCRKPFVSEPLPRNRVHEGIKTIERVASDVPLIQPERELVNVASEMLLADLVIDAVQSALENRPNASISYPPAPNSRQNHTSNSLLEFGKGALFHAQVGGSPNKVHNKISPNPISWPRPYHDKYDDVTASH